MADAKLKAKIRRALKGGLFKDPDDVVDVSDSDATDELVHLVIVSPKFGRRGVRENTEMIWDELERRLSPDEWGFVSLTIGVNPADVNGSTIADLKYT